MELELCYVTAPVCVHRLPLWPVISLPPLSLPLLVFPSASWVLSKVQFLDPLLVGLVRGWVVWGEGRGVLKSWLRCFSMPDWCFTVCVSGSQLHYVTWDKFFFLSFFLFSPSHFHDLSCLSVSYVNNYFCHHDWDGGKILGNYKVVFPTVD